MEGADVLQRSQEAADIANARNCTTVVFKKYRTNNDSRSIGALRNSAKQKPRPVRGGAAGRIGTLEFLSAFALSRNLLHLQLNRQASDGDVLIPVEGADTDFSRLLKHHIRLNIQHKVTDDLFSRIGAALLVL